MALLRYDADEERGTAGLAAALAASGAGPVVVMIHGFRFSPWAPGHSPHDHILSLAPTSPSRKAVSWPRHLGLKETGLAIAFGWEARGSFWRARAGAEAAGQRLAALLALLADAAPGRPVHLFAHSLGARVALAALRNAPPGAVRRAILISAACFRSEARRALAAPGGAGVEVINVISRENALFDLFLRLALPLGGPTLAGGLSGRQDWLDLPLRRLPGLGWRLAPARARICHWSGYLRPGVWAFYRDALHRPGQVPLACLREPERRRPARRGWSGWLPGFAARG